jgi:hypothetical protein
VHLECLFHALVASGIRVGMGFLGLLAGAAQQAEAHLRFVGSPFTCKAGLPCCFECACCLQFSIFLGYAPSNAFMPEVVCIADLIASIPCSPTLKSFMYELLNYGLLCERYRNIGLMIEIASEIFCISISRISVFASP